MKLKQEQWISLIFNITFNLYDEELAKQIDSFTKQIKDKAHLLICQCEFGQSRLAAIVDKSQTQHVIAAKETGIETIKSHLGDISQLTFEYDEWHIIKILLKDIPQIFISQYKVLL